VLRCTYPLTGIGVVKRLYTDLAVIDVTPRGLFANQLVAGTLARGIAAPDQGSSAASGARAAA